jgi:flagellin
MGGGMVQAFVLSSVLRSEVAVTSILTNSGATYAVDQLRAIMVARDDRQQELATGLRVKNAADNTAYWSIATTMRSDSKALSAVEDSLGFGAAAVDTAYTGMRNAIHVVDEIKKKLLSAREDGVDKKKINDELSELKEQLYTIADAGQFNGENWLSRKSAADDADKEVVGSFSRDAANNVSVKILTYSMTNALGTNHLVDEDSQVGILTNADYAAQLGYATDWVMVNGRNQTLHTEFSLSLSTPASDVDEMIGVTNRMQLAMTDAAAALGSLAARIKMQADFVVDLQDSQKRGVGRLVDADLDNSSAKLKAVEVQRQLAGEALSIANDSPRSLLPLLM